MSVIEIIVDVNCHRPAWVHEKHNINFLKSAYRIYINNELLIERWWAWDDNTLIREKVLVNLPINSTNQIVLEPVLIDPAQATFNFSNFTIQNQIFSIEHINDLVISFTLQ